MRKNHSDLINLWPSVADFAADLGIGRGLAYQWRSRNSVPAWYWEKLLDKARERRIYVTHEDLVCGIARRAA